MNSIEFKDVTFGYDKESPIFEGLSFTINQDMKSPAYVCGLLGGSGTGKSTILRLILGIEKCQKGSIRFSVTDPMISYMPQEQVLFDHISPLKNARYFEGLKKYQYRFDDKAFNEIAEVLNMNDFLHRAKTINEISGGQRQSIALLRSLSIKPDFLLLDEPLTGLDEKIKDSFLKKLAILVQHYNLTVLYVTHHQKEIEFISEDIIHLSRMDQSKSICEVNVSPTQQFFINPPTVSAFDAFKSFNTNSLKLDPSDQSLHRLLNNLKIDKQLSSHRIYFDEKSVFFSSEKGFKYEIAAEAGTHVVLKLNEFNELITISNEKYIEARENGKDYLNIAGEVKLYREDGAFLKTLELPRS